MTVTIICEKTGLSFEALNRRPRNHPQIMAWLSEANRDGWYGDALEVLQKGKREQLATLDAFVARLQEARDKKLGQGKYDFAAFHREHVTDIEAAIQAYLATYDETQPVEEDLRTLAGSPIGLLERRLAKYCVGPLVQHYDAPMDLQSRLITETVEAAVKPLREEQRKKEQEEHKLLRAELRARSVVKQESYRRGAPYAGDFSYFLPEQVILRCTYSRLDKAPTDYLQEEDSTYCEFAEVTEEEKLLPAYLQCMQWMQAALQKEQAQQETRAKLEARRKAELDAIRAEGREPDFFENLFAGTSEN